MQEIWNQIEDLLLERKRVIASLCGVKRGPAVVFSGGIHGNEPTGVIALINVFNKITQNNIPIKGSVLAFVGNRNALHHKERYMYADLNRMWTEENIEKLHTIGFNPNELHPEKLEMIEIDNLLERFIHENTESQRYFIDLHTTSSHTIPFAVIDDRKESFDLAQKFPLPFIQNFDRFIKGTLLCYLDHKDFATLVFEAGQHFDFDSIERHEAVIWITLTKLGVIDEKYAPNMEANMELLGGLSDNPHKVFEITHRQEVNEGDGFVMKKGYVNFQKIQKGEELAINKLGSINSPQDGRIFMPLYQAVGADGFFIIERVDNNSNES